MFDHDHDRHADSSRSRTEEPMAPPPVDRATFQAAVDRLRLREKAHTHEGDAIAAARRRLPMVEVDANLELTGPDGPTTLLEAFEGRRQLIAYYFMWHPGQPARRAVRRLHVVHHPGRRAVLPAFPRHHATRCSARVRTTESIRYRDFMDWDMPWYSARAFARRTPASVRATSA